MSSFSFGFTIGKAKKGGGISYDADAQAFFTATGITDTTQKSAVNQLVLDLKSYGIWTKMKAIYPIVGGTSTTHKYNLKDPRDLDAAFRLTFATGMTHSSTGMVSNGSSGYANTYLNGNTVLSATSNHMSFYSGTQVSAVQYEMGILITSQYSLTLFESVTVKKSFIQGTYPTNTATVNDSNTKGFQIGSKTSATSLKLYWNNSNVATNTASYSSAIQSGNIFLCAVNYNSGPTAYSTKECRFASIGDGLTDTESSNFYTAVQAMQTTLSRNV